MTKIFIQEDDYDFVLAEHKRRLHDDLTGAMKEGKKIKVITTNTPQAVDPDPEPRPEPARESLREKYRRLKAEVKQREAKHEK